jgi:hypothetical protein
MKIDYRTFNFEDFTRDENFRQWVLNYDANSAIFWENWITQNPDCIGKITLAKSFLYALEEKNTDLGFNELEKITKNIVEDTKMKSIWQSPLFLIAASILIIFGLGFITSNYFNKLENEKFMLFQKISPTLTNDFFEKENKENSTQQILLEDGSLVTLYPKSKLRYPKKFSVQTREVYLNGQAFFKITKNPKRPFWVFTNYISTQVLGTSFMIKAFENAKNIKVEVVSGKVSVYRQEDLQKSKPQLHNELAGLILTANQEVSFIKNDDRLIKSIIEKPEALIPIKVEEFQFDETPISKVFALLEKTYGINVIFDAKSMEDCFLTATLADESLYEKLDLICKITHSTYEIVDAQVIIHSKGCR